MNTWRRLVALGGGGNLAVGAALLLVVSWSRGAVFAEQPRLATIAVGLLVVQLLVNATVLTSARRALRRDVDVLTRVIEVDRGAR